MADLPGQPADRERAQARDGRDPQGLQLDRVHEPDLHQQLRRRSTTARSNGRSFNTITDAISKIKSGEADYDVFVPTPDNLGQLIEAKLIQPLNHSYIPNIEQCWPDYKNPFYDLGWQYTVPYTVYTTGISWRKDHVDGNPATWKNGYQFPWQKKYAGKVAILDDYREGLSLGLMYNGIYDLNTTSGVAAAALEGLPQRPGHACGWRADRQQRLHERPERPDLDPPLVVGRHGRGGAVHAQGRAGRGRRLLVPVQWDRTGCERHDGRAGDVEGSGARSPVPQLLPGSAKNAVENISYNGYIQPLTAITPQLLVKEKILPPSLMSTVVLPSYFRKGIFELELPPTTDVEWEQDWLEFSGGL